MSPLPLRGTADKYGKSCIAAQVCYLGKTHFTEEGIRMNRLVAFRTSIVAAAALMLSACGINSVPAAEETAKAKWADAVN